MLSLGVLLLLLLLFVLYGANIALLLLQQPFEKVSFVAFSLKNMKFVTLKINNKKKGRCKKVISVAKSCGILKKQTARSQGKQEKYMSDITVRYSKKRNIDGTCRKDQVKYCKE